MKLPKDFDVDALCSAAYRSRLALRYPREVRTMAVRQRAGFYYSTDSIRLPQPINMLEMYHTIIGGRLISNNPQANLTTDIPEARQMASAMMAWVNKQITKINLVETLQRVTEDSLDWFGIVMVALATPGDAAISGWQMHAGEPFALNVDPDDYVWDMHARRMDNAAWEAHRFRIPLAVANKMYGKDRKLEATDDKMYNLEGDERISNIGRTTMLGVDELEPMIDLWHFFIKRHKLCVIVRDDDIAGCGVAGWGGYNKGRVLDAYTWIGPDCGPYHKFVLKPIPGNSLPKGPIQDIIDLNESINILARKLMRQGDRQKEVIVGSNAASKDTAQVLKTNDGEAMYADRPDQIKAVMWGGPNQQNFQLMNAFIDRLSWLAGNLEIQGGLGPQSGTAKQDEMLNENSSATTQNMQQKTMNGVISVVKALIWFWYHSPYKVMHVTYSLPGMPSVTAPLQVNPHPGDQPQQPGQMARTYKFEDLNIHVDPYTVQFQSPQQRQQAIDQVVTQIILPLMQIMQAQGIQFDIRTYLEKKAKMQDMPDLLELCKMAQTQVAGAMGGPQDQGQQGQQPAAPVKPANTTRNYVRSSVPGTMNGQQMQIGNAMAPNNGVRSAT